MLLPKVATPPLTVALPTFAGPVTVVLPPLMLNTVSVPAVALKVAVPEICELVTVPPVMPIAPPPATSVFTVPPLTLNAPLVIVAVPMLPPLRLSEPPVRVAAPTRFEELPNSAFPPLIERTPVDIFTAAKSASSVPPALTVTLVGLIGPPFCRLNMAVADELP